MKITTPITVVVMLVALVATGGTCVGQSCDSAAPIPAGCDSMGQACDDSTCMLADLLGGFAENGIIFNEDLVQTYQGVVDGGLRREDHDGGLATYGATFDFGKLGLTEGSLL